MEERSSAIKTIRPLILSGIIAGVLLALFAVASYLVVGEELKANGASAAVINTSGRQRMLLKSFHLNTREDNNSKCC